MKSLKTIIFITSLLASLNAFSMDGKGERRGRGMMKKLGLSEEQVVQFKEIRGRFKPQMKENRKKIKELKNEFQNLMKSTDKSDGFKDNLLSKFDELQKLKTQSQRKRIEMALALREILTPEQISKFQELRSQRKGKRGKRGGRFRGNDQQHGPWRR